MRTIGVIAEYNPFHSGHRHHISEIRAAFGPDCAVIAVMSGNFVQRGDAAIADKWTRTGLALSGGADLVIELPTLWAAASAEAFARGGVSLLDAMGCVEVLSFGSEAGILPPLISAADCLDSEAWRLQLKKALHEGLPFPVARQRAADTLIGSEASCLETPNNNLGVEYLRALRALDSGIRPHTIPRLGAAHDAGGGENAPHLSGSILRARLLSGAGQLEPYLDPGSVDALSRDPAGLGFCARGILARLRAMEAEDFDRLPDCGEGLSNLLRDAAREARSLDELYSLVKSKRYTLARIRRLVLWAFLGLKASDRPAAPPYLRVLGFTDRGRAGLRTMKDTASLPVLTKPAHSRRLDAEARRVFRLEARCTGLYDLCRRDFGREPGLNEYTAGPARKH